MTFPDKKPILAIETSGEMCGVALFYDDFKFSELNLRIKYVHSEKIIDLIDQVLKTVGLQISGISALAISSGPGSFTGLRIGMSTVKGLAMGAGLPIIPVPTFEALAHQICTYIPGNTRFIIANKVNLEEAYYAAFRKAGSSYELVEKLEVLKNEDLDRKIDENTLIFGNYSIGSGNSNPHVCSPQGVSVARWAYLFGKDLLTYEYDFLEPSYLKNFVVKEPK